MEINSNKQPAQMKELSDNLIPEKMKLSDTNTVHSKLPLSTRKRKRKLIVDEEKEFSKPDMMAQLSNTADILTNINLGNY